MIGPELLATAQNELTSLQYQVAALQYAPPVTRQYTLTQIHGGLPETHLPAWLMQELGDNIRQPAIYSIEADSPETAQIIRASLQQEREDANRPYKLPRDNEQYQNTVALYVGSSGATRIRQRLKQHLWRAADGTYAMHMWRWMPDEPGSVILRVQSVLGEVDPRILQCVEDTLWQSLRPMYGKMGGR